MTLSDKRLRSARRALVALTLSACASLLLVGCGTTQSRSATEQLLTSDAVDRSIARIDFRPLRGQKVFLDIDYVRGAKGIGSVNAEYVISSLRQQLLAAGCLLQENKHLADLIVEPRVGALGLDGHDVIYGIPANNGLNLASTIVPTMPTLPTVPELALAKKNDQRAASKVAAFAYHRVTREVVWQSGVSQTMSTARDSWLFGAGPFQTGTIYKEPKFVAGVGLIPTGTETADLPDDVRYTESKLYRKPSEIVAPAPVVASTAFSASAPMPATSVASVSGATETAKPVVATAGARSSPDVLGGSRSNGVAEPPAKAEIPASVLELMHPEVAAALALPGQILPGQTSANQPPGRAALDGTGRDAETGRPRRGSRRLRWDEIERELGAPPGIVPAGATSEPAPFPESLTPTQPPRLSPTP